MSSLGSYELTHPELLSEYQLRKILQNSCIEIFSFEKLCRSELVEIYKQVAMPLPQRQYEDTKYLDIGIDTTQEKSSIKDNNIYSLSTTLNKGNKRLFQTSHLQADKLQSLVNDQKSIFKKIRLCSTSKIESGVNGIVKHKCNEQNEVLLGKKRQKITWP